MAGDALKATDNNCKASSDDSSHRLSECAHPKAGDNPHYPANSGAALSLPDLHVAEPLKLKPGSTEKVTMTVDGKERQLWLHVPPNYDPSKPAPLMLVFNGVAIPFESNVGAVAMDGFTGLSKAADSSGYVIAYLDGTNWKAHAWDDPGNDLHFTNQAIAALQKDLNIDPRRIDAIGHSEGGYALNKMLPDVHGLHNEKLAAVSFVEGWVDGTEKPIPATSAIIFHAAQDKAVPIAGTVQIKHPYLYGACQFVEGDFKEGSLNILRTVTGFENMQPTEKEVARYATADGAGKPQVRQDGSITETTYTNPQNRTEVDYYKAANLTHGWAGSSVDPPMKNEKHQDVGDTDLIVKFFNDHPRCK